MEPETFQNGLLWTATGQILNWIGALLSSAFGVALAGAGFGALGAGLVTKKIKDFDDKLLELRQTNAAIGICGTVCNSYLLVKDQFIRPLQLDYESKLADFEKVYGAMAKGSDPLGPPHRIEFNFQKFTPEPVGVERLQDLIFENLGSTIKVLHITITLVNAMKTVYSISKDRNDYIDLWENKVEKFDALSKFQRYFGKRIDITGHTDLTYSNMVEQLGRNTDDCIHFSDFLSSVLQIRAKDLKKELEKRTILSLWRKPKIPEVAKWDFSGSKEKTDSLFPDLSEYSGFHGPMEKSTKGASSH